MSNYATKADFKHISHVDTSSFALKSNLTSLKTEVHKLDIDKLVLISFDLSKLSDAAKSDVVKKIVYDKLVAKVNNIDTSEFVLKTNYDADKKEFDNKIPDISGPIKKSDYDAKVIEIEGKIPSISGLATNAALTTVGNKIPNVNSLVKKTDYDTKITEIDKELTDHNHDKYITTPEFNTLAADVFNARLKQTDLVRKTDFDDKSRSRNQEINSNKTKHLLAENELEKLKPLDLSYFKGKSHFKEDVTQNYLVFQPIQRYFKRIAGIGNSNNIYYWKSKGLYEERINSVKTSDYGITPYLRYYDANKLRVKFNGCFKLDQGTLLYGGIVNIYIVYEITDNFHVSSYPTLENCLFGAVKLTKNADRDKYGYSGYGIGFDRHGSFISPGIGLGRNVIIFGVDMSSSSKIDNKKKDILILGKGPTYVECRKVIFN